jgi:SsrA-binding protein
VAKPPAAKQDETKVLARNRKARHVYHIDETLEAGIVLAGSEVKSIRDGKVTLVDAFADIDKNEAWLHQVDISVYGFAHGRNHEPRRKRKLLLHRREIERLIGKTAERGLTIVPTRVYFKGPNAKVEIALAKGKDQRDKRRSIKDREVRREIDRAMSERY